MSIGFVCDSCKDPIHDCRCIPTVSEQVAAGFVQWPPKPPASSDSVNNPSHYASGDIECIDAIEASMSREAFCGYLKGNVQKYMWRYEKKINPVEDLKKAQWYQNRLIQTLEKQ